MNITSDSEYIGGTTANEGGDFSTPVVLSRIEPGIRTIIAECGATLTAEISVSVTTSTGGTTTTLVILIFFILTGALLARWQLGTGRVRQ